MIGSYPFILALEVGQALEKSRCFGQTGRAEGKNRGKQTMFVSPFFRTVCPKQRQDFS
jgi:hypothetical protein